MKRFELKKVTAFGVLALALTTGAGTAPAEEIVTTLLSPGRIAIHDVEGLEILQSHFDPAQPLDAFLDLELRLRVEGNLCGDDTLAFETDLRDPMPSHEAQEYDLFLRSMRQQTERIHLTPRPCLLISMPLDIIAPLRIEASLFGPDVLRQHWNYYLQDDFSHHGVLSVQLDAKDGWSAVLLPPEETDPHEEEDLEARKVFLKGTLTDEGVECPALRTQNGALYTLAGDLNGKGLEVGDTVYVVGTVAPLSFCMQGTTIAVDWISPHPPKRLPRKR